MLGQMMTKPLLISSLIEHASRYHGDTTIWSVETAGGVTETSWGEVGANARRLGSALTALGLEPQARCGTLAWNNRRHLEIYYGVSGAGYVCHTINPRLFPEQLVYIMNHAEDRVLFSRDLLSRPLIQANPALRGKWAIPDCGIWRPRLGRWHDKARPRQHSRLDRGRHRRVDRDRLYLDARDIDGDLSGAPPEKTGPRGRPGGGRQDGPCALAGERACEGGGRYAKRRDSADQVATLRFQLHESAQSLPAARHGVSCGGDRAWCVHTNERSALVALFQESNNPSGASS